MSVVTLPKVTSFKAAVPQTRFRVWASHAMTLLVIGEHQWSGLFLKGLSEHRSSGLHSGISTECLLSLHRSEKKGRSPWNPDKASPFTFCRPTCALQIQIAASKIASTPVWPMVINESQHNLIRAFLVALFRQGKCL